MNSLPFYAYRHGPRKQKRATHAAIDASSDRVSTTPSPTSSSLPIQPWSNSSLPQALPERSVGHPEVDNSDSIELEPAPVVNVAGLACLDVEKRVDEASQAKLREPKAHDLSRKRAQAPRDGRLDDSPDSIPGAKSVEAGTASPASPVTKEATPPPPSTHS